MGEVTNEQLQKEIAKILEKANLREMSTKKVIIELEKIFGVELAEKKKIIDEMVMDFVNKASDDEDKEEEEEKKRPNRNAGRGTKRPKAKKNASSSDDDDDDNSDYEKPARNAGRAKKPIAKRAAASDDDDDDAGSDYEKRPSRNAGRGTKRPKAKKNASSSDDDDDDNSDYEEKKPKSKAKKSKEPKKAGGRKGGGYTRPYKLSPALSELMGAEEMPRHEVVKRVWAIIKEKNLYDPNNKQFAICDPPLYKVFGIKRFRTFGMMKYLKTHFSD